MFRTAWQHSMKVKAGPALLGRLRRKTVRLELEALESRVVPSFAAPVSYNIGTQASAFNGSTGSDAVAVGDFRGDGKMDLAVAHTAENSLEILLNRGDGTFLPAVSYPTRGIAPMDIVVRDFNGDGKLDVAVMNPGDPGNNFTSSISIFLGNGDGTFQPAVTYASGRLNRGLAVGDFWGDGKLDLATTNFLDDTVSIFRGNGDGTFQPRITIAVPHGPRGLIAGDFDGSGGPAEDLAVIHGTNPSDGLSIFLGNGNGTFQAPREYATPPTSFGDTPFPEDVIAADLRNNGRTDLIVSLYDHNIDVFLGNGDGTFQQAAGFDTGQYPRAVAVADVNGDGIKDLVVGNIGNLNQGENGSVAVLLGNGDGTFQSAIQYTPVNFPGWVAVGDFNGDGSPDVAFTRVQDGHAVEVMLNQGFVNLAVTGHDLSAVAGQVSGTVATFTDSHGVSSYTAQISWSDGQFSPGQVTANGDGTYTVTGTHQYVHAGVYTLHVSISAADGGTGSASSTAAVSPVDNGLPLPVHLHDVAIALTTSAEYYSNRVTLAYQDYVGRAPDPNGLAYWISQLQHGMTDEQLEAGFIGSAEYIRNHGGAGAAWVIGMYNDLLGRSPDTAGLNYWVEQLRQGVAPSSIALGFSASAEREGQRVTEDYQHYLGRMPAASEVNYWVDQFVNHGLINEGVIAGFVSSAEDYHDHFSDPRDWLFGAYRDILGRPIDAAGLNTWLPLLQS